MSVRQIERIICDLALAGSIEIKRRPGRVNVYRIVKEPEEQRECAVMERKWRDEEAKRLEERKRLKREQGQPDTPDIMTGVDDEHPRQNDGTTPDKMTPHPRQDDGGTPDKMTGNPILEPVPEPVLGTRNPPDLRSAPTGAARSEGRAPSARRRRAADEPFEPPTLEAVLAYAEQKGIPPALATEFYWDGDRKGWTVGRAARPMKSWPGALHYYASQEAKFHPNGSGQGGQRPGLTRTEKSPQEQQREIENRRRDADERDQAEREIERIDAAIAAMSQAQRDEIEQEARRRVLSSKFVRDRDPNLSSDSSRKTLTDQRRKVFSERYPERNWRNSSLPAEGEA